jgi:hypothetical protein
VEPAVHEDDNVFGPGGCPDEGERSLDLAAILKGPLLIDLDVRQGNAMRRWLTEFWTELTVGPHDFDAGIAATVRTLRSASGPDESDEEKSGEEAGQGTAPRPGRTRFRSARS